MLTAMRAEHEKGTVLLLFPTAVLIMVLLGAIVVDVGLTQVRARELDAVAGSAANDALAAPRRRCAPTGRRHSASTRPLLGAVAESVAAGSLPTRASPRFSFERDDRSGS
ncbi:MAG: hypothetical protein R2695_04245 [Acidimicrobiales bacterium]